MNTWKVIFATLVIFITGVVTGGLLVSYSDRAHQKTRRPSPRELANRPLNAPVPGTPRVDGKRLPNLPNRPPHVLSMEFLQKLDRELHLSPAQRDRIEKLITTGQQRNKELWERIAPDVRREITETQKRIREELTPEQRARFEELMKQRAPRKVDESMSPDRRPRDKDRPRDAARPDGSSSRSPDNR